MKLIKNKFEIIEPRAIPDNIGSKEFVENITNSKNLTALEHDTVYLMVTIGQKEVIDDCWDNPSPLQLIERYVKNKYSKVTFEEDYKDVFIHTEAVKHAYITTNLRTLVENNWLDDLKYLCEPTEYHEKRYCVRFICDRGVSKDIIECGKFSFLQEFIENCSYNKKELIFIMPNWINIPEGDYTFWDNDWCDVSNFIILKHYEQDATDVFLDALTSAESLYFLLLKRGWNLQQASQILPNALKTELVITGFISDWKSLFSLNYRHPNTKALINSLQEEFIKRNYCN